MAETKAASATATDSKRVVLGSGENYLCKVDGQIDTSNIDTLITKYFTDANLWGDTKNGASITYTPTTYTVYDDLGKVTETFLTKEDVKLSMGLVRVNSKILAPLMDTARVSTSGTKTVVKVGGINNASGESYFVGFKHTDLKRGTIYVMIVGKNEGELQLTFNPETETILNPTFVANAMDAEGTKLIIVTEPPKASASA